MNVLIIGAGNMGRGIATRFAAAKANLIIHDVDATKAEALATELGGTTPGARIAVARTQQEAVATSDVVILASWYAVNLETAKALGAALDGKIVVQISNPLNDSHDGFATKPGTSSAETIRADLPVEANVLKAFNTPIAGTLVCGEVAS
jgi:hypothetical protein